MHVILLFANTVFYQLPLRLRLSLRLRDRLQSFLEDKLFDKSKASVLKIYLQDKFPWAIW